VPNVTTTVQGLAGLKELVGADLGHSDWLEITQDRVNTFADATDDHQWIHVDPDRARSGPFGGPIAHGYLTLSLVIPLFANLLHVEGTSMGVNYGLEKVRFPTPVPVGARVRLHATLVSATDVPPNAVQIAVNLTVELENHPKPACAAQALYRHYA
jgi:acyl dehydratase